VGYRWTRLIRGGINQMATEDGFQPDRPPIFLSGDAEETGPPEFANGWDVATISSRILKASILAVVVTAIGIAVLSVGNPVVLVANMTDWWVDKPALQPEPDPATSPIQTIAATQDLPATTRDAPARDETAAAGQPANLKNYSSNSRPGRRRKRRGHRPEPGNPCKLRPSG
jgi:hypothetical protein